MAACVSPIVRTTIVPSEAVACLRSPRSASGYRNVYCVGTDENGHAVYKARVKRGGVLQHVEGSRSGLPHVSALYVARWYEERFGPRWQDVLRWRKRAPYDVRRVKSGGYAVTAHVEGKPQPVVRLEWVARWKVVLRDGAGRVVGVRVVRSPRGRWQPVEGNPVAVFPTRRAALEGMRLYLRRLYGIFAEAILYRGDTQVPGGGGILS